MQVLALDHAAVRTDKLEEMCSFFVHTLGLSVGPRPPVSLAGYWLYAGDRAVVHLVECQATPGPASEASIDHFALRVADLNAAAAELIRQDTPFNEATDPSGALTQLFIRAPNGMRVELTGPNPRL
ncbi:MAG: VOC family protein [Phenylobacterium sp.]|uniref:VOC family protein n=1 Tax=Phenylobacterium sp. TaxID=1871053 RepID=UPI002736F483|nr:VOC family protein [Phenylobacterium sp.]MDP3175203.1 VOC family protein [Phenylobacterium sp.]